jgi:membrane-associated protein
VAFIVFAGFYLGNTAVINNNIDAVLILIVATSLVPVAIELLLHRRHAATAEPVAEPTRWMSPLADPNIRS